MHKIPFLRKPITCLLSCLCVLFLLPGCLDGVKVDQTFGGGNGTEQNPYQVSTIDGLQAIDDEEYLDKHFIQVADIDASQGLQDGLGFKHIGDREMPFTGSYDGNGYIINDLTLQVIQSEMHIGLFGYLKGGMVENVTVKNSLDHQEKYKRLEHSNAGNVHQPILYSAAIDDLTEISSLGFLVGFNEEGVVRNCRIETNVGANFKSVGGLVGINAGVIEQSNFYGEVSSLNISAGLVGINTGKITDSSSGGRVAGPTTAGLAGQNNGGEIIRSFTTANVSSGFFAGGLTAYNSGRIVFSYSTGNEIFDSSGIIGGLVAQNNGDIEDSYTTTDLDVFFEPNTEIVTGGLAGQNLGGGMIVNSYAAGSMNTPGEMVTGGFVGSNYGQIITTYWNTETTGLAEGAGAGNPGGTTGLTTSEMTGSAAEANMPEFDWQTVWRTTDSYPLLQWQQE